MAASSTGLRPQLQIHASTNVRESDGPIIRSLKEDGLFNVPTAKNKAKHMDCVIVGQQGVLEWVQWSRMFKNQAGGDKINFMFEDPFNEDSHDIGSPEKFNDKFEKDRCPIFLSNRPYTINSPNNSTIVNKYHIAGIPNDSATCVTAFLNAVLKSALDAQSFRSDGVGILIHLYLNPKAMRDIEMVRHWCWETKQSIPDWMKVNQKAGSGPQSTIDQALPVLALHTSDCVTQPKGPVFTGLHRDGRMKMVEPGARCSSVDVVVVGMQGMKHRVEWLTAFEEFKRAGSPQIAFAEGITDAKRDFETKKIDVTFDNTKYLPIIVTNRGINITNVSVDKLHVVGLPHCGNPRGFLEEIWQMAAETQKRKTTSIIDIVLYGPSAFEKKQKNPSSPTWEHVMRWCEMRKLPKPLMPSAPHVIELGDSDEDIAEVSFMKKSRRERKDILRKTERHARLEFRSIRSGMDFKDPSGTFFSQLTNDGFLAATKEPAKIIDIVMVGRPESQSDLVHTFEQTNLASPTVLTWFMNSVELDAEKVNTLPEYEYQPNNAKTYPVLLTNRGIRPLNVSVKAIHAIRLPDSTQSAFDTFMDEAVMTADAAAISSRRPKVTIHLYLHQQEKDVARMLVEWASSRQWNLPTFVLGWSKDPSEKCGKNWRKRALKEKPELASKAPTLAKEKVDLMRQFASFTLTLGNEHVSQIVLFVGTNPTDCEMKAYEDISGRGLCNPRSAQHLGLSNVLLLVNGRPPSVKMNRGNTALGRLQGSLGSLLTIDRPLKDVTSQDLMILKESPSSPVIATNRGLGVDANVPVRGIYAASSPNATVEHRVHWVDELIEAAIHSSTLNGGKCPLHLYMQSNNPQDMETICVWARERKVVLPPEFDAFQLKLGTAPGTKGSKMHEKHRRRIGNPRYSLDARHMLTASRTSAEDLQLNLPPSVSEPRSEMMTTFSSSSFASSSKTAATSTAVSLPSETWEYSRNSPPNQSISYRESPPLSKIELPNPVASTFRPQESIADKEDIFQGIELNIPQNPKLPETTSSESFDNLTLHTHFRRCQEKYKRRSSVGDDMMSTWRMVGHNETTLRNLCREKMPTNQNELKLLLMRELDGMATLPKNHSITDVIADTAEYFLPSEEQSPESKKEPEKDSLREQARTEELARANIAAQEDFLDKLNKPTYAQCVESLLPFENFIVRDLRVTMRQEHPRQLAQAAQEIVRTLAEGSVTLENVRKVYMELGFKSLEDMIHGKLALEKFRFGLGAGAVVEMMRLFLRTGPEQYMMKKMERRVRPAPPQMGPPPIPLKMSRPPPMPSAGFMPGGPRPNFGPSAAGGPWWPPPHNFMPRQPNLGPPRPNFLPHTTQYTRQFGGQPREQERTLTSVPMTQQKK